MTDKLETIFTRRSVTTAVATVALMAAPAMFAQEQTATVHGHVKNAAGFDVTAGQVKFTKDIHASYKDEKFTNTVEVGKDGNYTATGIAPGEYFAYIVVDDKAADQVHFTVKPGDNLTEDFDMSRPEYIAKMTPEEKKALEEYKAKTAAAMSNNKVVANLNATITAVKADIKTPAPNFDKDISDMKQATDARPTEGVLWAVQAEVYVAQGKKAAAADRANKTSPMQDDAVKTAYENAENAYKKGIEVMAANPKPNTELEAGVYNELGNLYGEENKPKEATDAYDKAVSLDPKNAAASYYNAAAVMFNTNQYDEAAAVADKAIQAGSTKPILYYIKGTCLYRSAVANNKIVQDPKTGKFVPPPGMLEAYNKYLELEPDGPQAAEVKETLTELGQKVETHYRAPGKH
ncbi:MAG TPA: tetratricopeptide repeat protein [Acidobacteriaceae bacterium]|nr:tetratricopeptide repeat protein [Acidobacteriaceae bacterium]